jgi:hypothetical protein
MGLRQRGVWLVFLFLVSLGCGKGGGPQSAPVSGRITMDKRPLADADVTFTPTEAGKQGTPARGKTDADGRYTLKQDDGVEGAVVGNAKVAISIFDRGTDGKPPRGQLVPPKYNTQSQLTFNVPSGGTTEANFDLAGGLTGGSFNR